MCKLLFITNLAKRIGSFSLSSISAATANGLKFYQAANWSEAEPGQIEKDQEKYAITIRNVDIARSPFSKANMAAYKQIIDLIEQESIDYIHCNTPVGGLLGRLAGKKCGVKKVIYQAHGFHFYKGAPKKNWLLYYTAERFLAHWTDAIITMNREDYEAAKKFKLRKGGKVYFVHGVGIDLSDFEGLSHLRQQKRGEMGLGDEDIALISAGELNGNKNNTVIISALSKLKNRKIHYFLCGVGNQESILRQQAEEAGIAQQVHFLGYRRDMMELLQAADVFVMPSFREGLSRSIMEAMASGLPCVVSKIRGNVDLVEDGENGFLCSAKDADGFAEAIGKIATDPALRERMRTNNLEKIKQYDISVVEQEIRDIYTDVLGKN